MKLHDDNFRIFAKQYKDNITALGEYAAMLYAKGDFLDAAKYYIECVNKDWIDNKNRRVSVIAQAGAACYASKNFNTAYKLFKLAVKQNPHKRHLLSNLGSTALKLGKYDEAIKYLLQSHKLDKEYVLPLDGLVTVYSRLGEFDNAHKYGCMSLKLKDKQAHDEANLDWLKTQLNINKISVEKPIPQFNCDTPARNIIAFSLWGNDPVYIKPAIINALIAPIIYPGWRARFYCDDSVAPESIKQLKENQAEVIITESKGAFHGLFWRFLVASDPEIDRFLIRDCDAVLNCQERVAVDEWLTSNKHFHLMRDCYTHNELILAGMWGGVGGIIPNISSLIDAYYKKSGKVRSIDQQFLRHCIWPFVKQSCLTHDEYFKFGHAKPFPKLGKFPDNRWTVGQNWQALYLPNPTK